MPMVKSRRSGGRAEEERMLKAPHPGSPEAVEQGCACPVIDNARGRGHLGDGERFGWWTDALCPIHGTRREETSEDAGVTETLPDCHG